jgi:hypothetical protein
MSNWEGVPDSTREHITALCKQGNADIRIGHRRWVPCWMCGVPIEWRGDRDYHVEKPVCSTFCAHEKRQHYD